MKTLGFKFKAFFIGFWELQLYHRGLEYTNLGFVYIKAH